MIGKLRIDDTDVYLRLIVGRVHVGKPYRYALREVIRSLKPKRGKSKYATWRSLPRDTRHSIMRQVQVIRAHDRKLYAQVMSGRF